MRFSLKDMMWSVTLASLGIIAPVMALRNDGDLGFSAPINDLLGIFACLSFGPLLGAAIGTLFGKSFRGAAWGMLVWLMVCLTIFAIVLNTRG
jgi:hypothetical protein